MVGNFAVGYSEDESWKAQSQNVLVSPTVHAQGTQLTQVTDRLEAACDRSAAPLLPAQQDSSPLHLVGR